MLLWLGITLAMAAVATVFADAVAALVPSLAGRLPRAALLVAMFVALTIVNVRGATWGSRLSGISTLAKLVPLLAFVALGLPHVRAANITFSALPPLETLGGAGLLLMFAFFGMESALQVSGEVVDASRTVPRAIALALLGVALLYVSVQLVAQGVLGSALGAPEAAKAPLAAAAERFAGPAGARLILIGMIVSTFGFMTAMMLSTPRTLFALAADGFLPQFLAAVHSEHRTPHVAIAAQAIIVVVIALSGTYVKLALLADVAILIVYLACCVGAGRLRRLNASFGGKPFLMPAGSVVPWLAAVLIVGLLARATAMAWLLTGAVVVVASIAFLARRRWGRR
ncbi:MAG: APC family permease [Gemmatimonadales bacterium]